MASTTDIANMALARIGSNRINDLDTDANVQAVQCRLCYEADRDALLRMFWWPFAAARAILVASVTAPAFEYDYAYALPSDFLALRSIWDESEEGGITPVMAELEGAYVLSSETPLSIRYTKKVIDPGLFDPLFVRTLATQMALDMLYPLAGNASVGAGQAIKNELEVLMIRSKMMHLAEQNLIGRTARRTWLDARLSNGGLNLARLGS